MVGNCSLFREIFRAVICVSLLSWVFSKYKVSAIFFLEEYFPHTYRLFRFHEHLRYHFLCYLFSSFIVLDGLLRRARRRRGCCRLRYTSIQHSRCNSDNERESYHPASRRIACIDMYKSSCLHPPPPLPLSLSLSLSLLKRPRTETLLLLSSL